MAVGDLYIVEMRAEQAGVVMSTSWYYGQIGTPTAGGNPATDLAQAALDVDDGLAGWMRALMNDDATIACVTTEKVYDDSATGPESAVAFDTGIAGILAEALPPSNTLQVHQIGETGVLAEPPQRVTHLGGISESSVNNYAFNATIVPSFTLAGLVRLLQPKAPGEAGNPWQLSVPIRGAAPTYTIAGFTPVDLVPMPIFPSLIGSRQGFLCA